MQLSEIKKSIINVLTIVVTAGPWILDALNVLPGGKATATVVSSILGLAAVALHYLVPNTTTDPLVAETSSAVFKPNPKKVAKTSRKRKSAATAQAVAAPHPNPKLHGSGAHEKPEADPPVV